VIWTVGAADVRSVQIKAAAAVTLATTAEPIAKSV
jgi:hypothetical protein